MCRQLYISIYISLFDFLAEVILLIGLTANGWSNVGLTSVAKEVLHIPTYCQPPYIKQCFGTTLVRHE